MPAAQLNDRSTDVGLGTTRRRRPCSPPGGAGATTYTPAARQAGR